MDSAIFWVKANVQTAKMRLGLSNVGTVPTGTCSNAMNVLLPCIKHFLCIALRWSWAVTFLSPDRLTFLFPRNGKAIFLRRTLSKILDIIFNLAILERNVHLLNLAPRTSSSSISRALILLPLTIAIVLTNLCQHGNSYSAQDGSRPLFRVLKLSSRLIVLKLSMNSLFKGRRASTTTTILSYGDQITPISWIRL